MAISLRSRLCDWPWVSLGSVFLKHVVEAGALRNILSTISTTGYMEGTHTILAELNSAEFKVSLTNALSVTTIVPKEVIHLDKANFSHLEHLMTYKIQHMHGYHRILLRFLKL